MFWDPARMMSLDACLGMAPHPTRHGTQAKLWLWESRAACKVASRVAAPSLPTVIPSATPLHVDTHAPTPPTRLPWPWGRPVSLGDQVHVGWIHLVQMSTRAALTQCSGQTTRQPTWP